MRKKEVPIAGDSDAVISNSMEQNYRFAIRIARLGVPCPQNSLVRGYNRDILDTRMKLLSDVRTICGCIPQRPFWKTERNLSERNPRHDASRRVAYGEPKHKPSARTELVHRATIRSLLERSSMPESDNRISLYPHGLAPTFLDDFSATIPSTQITPISAIHSTSGWRSVKGRASTGGG